MIAVADMFEKGPISAPFGCVPLHIILVVSGGPSRQVDRLQAIRCDNIRNNNIKFTCLWIVVLNGDFTLWLGASNYRLS